MLQQGRERSESSTMPGQFHYCQSRGRDLSLNVSTGLHHWRRMSISQQELLRPSYQICARLRVDLQEMTFAGLPWLLLRWRHRQHVPPGIFLLEGKLLGPSCQILAKVLNRRVRMPGMRLTGLSLMYTRGSVGTTILLFN